MKNWTDYDYLEYLMTSDFDEDNSPEDLKFLLKKFRNFYRVQSTQYQNYEFEKKKFDFVIENLKTNHENELENLNQRILMLTNKIESLFNRKLTLKERFLGKIQAKENESL